MTAGGPEREDHVVVSDKFFRPTEVDLLLGDPAKAKAEMENEREDYRAIAVRRVRLGLLLSEIGQATASRSASRKCSA